jgi:hypothetical protein
MYAAAQQLEVEVAISLHGTEDNIARENSTEKVDDMYPTAAQSRQSRAVKQLNVRVRIEGVVSIIGKEFE